MSRYILALDQGTTSSRAIVFSHEGFPVASAQQEIRQYYPRPGWVEHDPEDIWESQLSVARLALQRAAIQPQDVVAIGITNQRETTLIWDRRTGRALHPAIVWQDRRTAEFCERIKPDEAWLNARTGLLADSYFSATKLAWLLEIVEGARRLADDGHLAFGTVDSFLLWRLTEGRVHATDVTNASRTLLFDIHRREWSDELLEFFGIPRSVLPEVMASSEVVGETTLLGGTIPIAGIAGDQQAATFGQACFLPGRAKSTYGTGCFILVPTGSEQPVTDSKLLTTLTATGDFSLEGSVFVAGAAIQWLRDEMGLIGSAEESETIARSVPDSAGVVVVPAFAGLGAPYWDSAARGAVVGLTRGTGRAHVVRATLESIAFQCHDVLSAMGLMHLRELRVDGGAVTNDFLMQFQADILGIPVVRPRVTETTALGVAYLAGLATGYWDSRDEIESLWAVDRVFEPGMSEPDRKDHLDRWHEAVDRVR
ncbi:MAG: glycerol kinase GlpK [Fimbriimonas sp.]